jgi:replication factor C subunit 3/5
VAAAEGLDASEEGLSAVQLLSGGDMRRALNILQATAMAAPNGRVDDEAVYACTGQPRPADIEAAAHALLNEPFASALHALTRLQAERGLALVDIARGLLPYVFRLHVPAEVRVGLVEALSEVEFRMAYVTGEKLQRAALVGAFATAREGIVAAAA